ncbi:hypothetical protein BH11BAC4_BH11BAC4_05470 [soil metagenome]
MRQNRFIRNISASTLQLIINQVFGLLIFYALSKGLDKNIFGQINWSLALLLTVFGVLTFGIDQLMVKKIAAGHDRQSIFSAYLFHVLTSGFIFYGLLLASWFLFPGIAAAQFFLLLIGIGKLFIFFSTPFKQVAAGLEKFTAVFYMSVVSNIIRGFGLLLLLLMNNMTVSNVLIIFISGDLLELLTCIFIARPILNPPIRFSWDKKFQISLLKESLPQAGVVVFSAVLSRLDWILVGILVSSISLAEYSFAWKIFEVSTLPLLIIAPLMLPLFTRIFSHETNSNDPAFLLEWQVIIGSFIALLLNLCWVPVIGFLTDGKYGAVNSNTIFILSLTMPMLYLNNYLWTINFAKGKLGSIFFIMAFSVAVNIIGCLILIPIYKNKGAALAYLLTITVQMILYLGKTSFSMPFCRRYLLLLWPTIAVIIGFIANRATENSMTGIFVSMLIYITVVFISRQVKGKDWKTLYSLYQ